MAKKEFTAKQAKFIKEYLIDLNASQAAARAGYSKKSSGEEGARLLSNVRVSAEIKAEMAKREKRTEVTQDYVISIILDTIKRCQQAEPVLDRKGNHVLIENAKGKMVPAYVFEPRSIMKGAELLGKHVGIFEKDNKQKQSADAAALLAALALAPDAEQKTKELKNILNPS